MNTPRGRGNPRISGILFDSSSHADPGARLSVWQPSPRHFAVADPPTGEPPMHRRTALALTLAAGLAPPLAAQAHAQTLRTPTFYTWLPQPSDPGSGNPYMVETAWAANWNSGYPDNATLAADQVAAQILADLYPPVTSPPTPPRMQAGKIAILLNVYGLDSSAQDDPTSYWFTSNVRFFREEDRLPGVDDYLSFPQPRNDDDPMSDSPDARAYRHPFLLNGLPPIGNPGDPGFWEPPLRAWTRAFCQRYDDLRAARLIRDPSHPLPIPDQMIYDTEPVMSFLVNLNAPWLLAHLADDTSWSARGGTTWTGIDVPGYPTGTKLATLYAAAAGTYGWPSNIFDTARGLLRASTQGGNDPRNQPYMIWWGTVLQHVSDFIMKQDAYDMAHQFWGAHDTDGSFHVKCSNFNASTLGGQAAPTGWFMDWHDPLAHDYRQPSNQFYHTYIDRSSFGALMHAAEVSGGSVVGRWLDLPQINSGQMDAPEPYRLNTDQHLGSSHNGWIGPSSIYNDGHQQPNLYLPSPTPVETLWQTTQRLNRHTFEGISPDVDHATRLQPWLEMAWSYATNPPNAVTLTVKQVRSLLSLLRSKNAPGGIFWSDCPYGECSVLEAAWEATAPTVQAVYAPSIYNYEASRGTLTDGSGIAYDPSRLEFTLPDTNGDRVVGIQTKAGDNITELLVKFQGLQNVPTSIGTRVYEFRIEETSSTDTHTYGMLLAWDFHGGVYVAVPVVVTEAEDNDLGSELTDSMYGYYTPDRTSRRIFHLIPTGLQSFVNSFGSMQIKLVHTVAPFPTLPPIYSVRYDLVQLAPFDIPPIGGGESPTAGGFAIAQSDMNYDQVVDPTDAAQFFAAYADGELSADMNADGVIDTADLAIFLTHYVNGD
jgi:hypothetical protein